MAFVRTALTTLRGRPYAPDRAVADTLAAKSPSGPAPLAPSPEASLAALPVDLADLPADVLDRVRARAHARTGRLSIGRYVITGELGRGGMGVVYDAWDPRIDRRVAIKTIEPDLVPDEGEREEVIERFLREIKVVGKLQHPSIVTIFDYGEDPELRRGDDPYASGRIYFYVMEYLEGRSLAKILREKKQLVDLDAVQIGLDVAEALRVAHARGIIHRDIKPSNILIRGDQRAVLLDFGIAKTGQPALTRQGQILGTPTYLAPERLREKEDGLDGRADIFSLGVLLYTMLVGEAPFQGDNVYDLLDNIAKQMHTKLARSTQGGVVLSRAIDRMLAKRPQDRYATADEVVQALKSAQALLEQGTPDVSDLGAGLVLVSEPMGDAATEIATPSEPIATPAMLPASGQARRHAGDEPRGAAPPLHAAHRRQRRGRPDLAGGLGPRGQPARAGRRRSAADQRGRRRRGHRLGRHRWRHRARQSPPAGQRRRRDAQGQREHAARSRARAGPAAPDAVAADPRGVHTRAARPHPSRGVAGGRRRDAGRAAAHGLGPQDRQRDPARRAGPLTAAPREPTRRSGPRRHHRDARA
jgi:serine/threonine protein kinase